MGKNSILLILLICCYYSCSILSIGSFFLYKSQTGNTNTDAIKNTGAVNDYINKQINETLT